MKVIQFLIFSILISVCVWSCRHVQERSNTRPNIVLIMADDMGYSDIGCFGGEIPTPAIDQLAENGQRFSQFYNAARCCPTRASLLTGLHPHQTGIGHMTCRPGHPDDYKEWGTPGYRGYLNRRCVTMAEVLQAAGYRTYMTGKWHLGVNQKDRWPLQRGFDKFYGILSGACSYLRPSGQRGLTYQNDSIPPPEGDYYTTDAFTDSAIAFISEKSPDPFFLYLAYNAPHWPLQAKEEDIRLFRNQYAQLGWDEMRKARLSRQKRIGIFPESTSLSKRDSMVRPWNEVNPVQKEESDYRMATYAAQIYRMDLNIGKLVNHLKKLKKHDNTLIFFLSDNGACAEPYNEFGGQDVADINDPEIWWNVSIGRGWANACNTPLTRYKSMTHEGGISTPLIIQWPHHLGKKAGQILETPAYLIDVLPTVIDVAQAKYPAKEATGDSIFALEGKSLLPVLEFKTDKLHDYMFWEHQDHCAIRKGRWKAVRDLSSEKWELYDLSVDRIEENNVAGEQPEIVQELDKKWSEWAESHQVLPKKKI